MHQSVALQVSGEHVGAVPFLPGSDGGRIHRGDGRRESPDVVVHRSSSDRLWIQHEYVPLVEGDGVWESPYSVVLGVTQGMWHDTADIYKRWAIRQPWSPKTLAQRDDIPAWWKAGPAVHVFKYVTLRCPAERQWFGPSKGDGATSVSFARTLDGPVAPMLAGWENHRRWTAGDYFPIFDQASAPPILRQLGTEGFRPFFFLSGWITPSRTKDETPRRFPLPRNNDCTSWSTGRPCAPRVWSLNESSRAEPGSGTRTSSAWPIRRRPTSSAKSSNRRTPWESTRCKWTRPSKRRAMPVLRRTTATGQDRGSIRLAISRTRPGCVNTASDSHRNFVLFHEEPHEQLMPFLDGFHVREYYERQWYRSYPGAVGISAIRLPLP